jgi:anti-anti-sigma factor
VDRGTASPERLGPTASPERLGLTARDADGIAVAELTGDLGVASSAALRDQLAGMLDDSSGWLVVDLSGVTSCDVSGLAMLLGTAHRASQGGGSLVLAAVTPQVGRALRRTGLYRQFSIAANVPAAIASLRSARAGTAEGVGTEMALPG